MMDKERARDIESGLRDRLERGYDKLLTMERMLTLWQIRKACWPTYSGLLCLEGKLGGNALAKYIGTVLEGISREEYEFIKRGLTEKAFVLLNLPEPKKEFKPFLVFDKLGYLQVVYGERVERGHTQYNFSQHIQVLWFSASEYRVVVGTSVDARVFITKAALGNNFNDLFKCNDS